MEQISLNKAIEDEAAIANEDRANLENEHTYIDALLQGLPTVTSIAMTPLTEILKDCMVDRDKEKYQEKILNCYESASLLSKLAAFTNHVEKLPGKTPTISNLGPQITGLLITLNPRLAAVIENHNARETVWQDTNTLIGFTKSLLEPIVKTAIKNIFLSSQGYPDQPNPDSNSMKLNLQEGRLSEVEKSVNKMEAVSTILVKEIADLKLAKAAAAFGAEERHIRLNPLDRDDWRKKTDEDKRKKISDLLKITLNNHTADKFQIRMIKEGARSPDWIKLTLPTGEDKYKFEAELSKLRNKANAESRSSPEKGPKKRPDGFTSMRLTPLSFKNEEKTMRTPASAKLTEDWISQLKTQGATRKGIKDREKLKGMWNLRLKWKYNPTFSVWLELQDPCHRHSWVPVDMGRENLFDHYDFDNPIPDPVTRNQALTNPAKPLSPREHSFGTNYRYGPGNKIRIPSDETINDLIEKQNLAKEDSAKKQTKTNLEPEAQRKALVEQAEIDKKRELAEKEINDQKKALAEQLEENKRIADDLTRKLLEVDLNNPKPQRKQDDKKKAPELTTPPEENPLPPREEGAEPTVTPEEPEPTVAQEPVKNTDLPDTPESAVQDTDNIESQAANKELPDSSSDEEEKEVSEPAHKEELKKNK